MENGTLDKIPKKHYTIRVLLKILVLLIVFLFSLILILNIPSVQTFITQKIINSIQSRVGSELSIGSVKIVLPNTVDLKDIYIQDQNKDTLLYLHSLNANIDLLKLFNNKIYVNSLYFENLVTNIHRKQSESKFNFQFFINAFSDQMPDTADTPAEPWLIKVKDISLKNVRATFVDTEVKIDARIALSNFEGTIKDFDVNKKQILIDRFYLKSTSLKIVSKQNGTTKHISIAEADSSHVKESDDKEKYIADFLPDWNFSIRHFSLDNIDLQYDNSDIPRITEGFDNNHMYVNNLNTEIKNISIYHLGATIEINSLSFNESCGFSLKKISVHAKLTEQLTELKDLKFESSHSKISGDAILSFSSFKDLLANTGNCKAILDIKNAEINTNEVFLLEHVLDINKFADKFRNTKISIVAKANGKINDLKIENLEISLLEKTKLKTHGTLKGLPEFSKLRFNAELDLLSTIKPDLYRFIDLKSFTSLNIPKLIEVNGKVSGKSDSLLAEFLFNSSSGSIAAKGFYLNRKNGKDTINLNFAAKDILAGVILGDTIYGKTSFSGNAGLVRTDDGLYYGSAGIMIQDAQYNSYVYKNIQINSQLEGDVYSTIISSDDANINFNLSTKINLGEAKKKYSANLDISNLNFQALNFTQKKITLSTNLNGELSYGGIENAEVNVKLINTNLIIDDKLSPVNLFDLKANSSSQGIDVTINSDILDGSISSNITAENLEKTFQTAFRKYWGDTIINNLPPGKSFSFLINSRIPMDIIQLFNSKFNDFEINKFEGKYTSDNNDLSVLLQMPKVSYSGVLSDTLTVVLNGKNDSLHLILDCNKLSTNNLQIKKIRISEKTSQGKIKSEISVRDSLEVVRYLFANELEFEKDFYKIKFLPNGIILGGKEWKVDTDNFFELKKELTDERQTGFSIQDFVFANDDKLFGIVSEEGNQIIRFRNFALQDLLDIAEFHNKTQLFGKGSKFIKGKLDGDIVLPAFPKSKDIVAKLTINDLYILDSLAGNLSLSIKEYNDTWDIDAGLTNQENKILLNGSIDHLSVLPSLNLNASIDIKNINRLERFSFGTLSEMAGKFSGKVNLSGTIQKPEIVGKLEFEETTFKVNSLNFFAKLNHEKILVNNKGFHFDNFIIEDLQTEKFIINGDLQTNNWSNLEFDLSLSSKKFQPINSTSADNPIFFGKLSLGADVKLKGFLKSPEIEANIQIDSITNLTYAFPGSELKLVTSEGIVEFQDSSQAFDSSLIAQEDYLTDSIFSRMKGVNLKARIEIDPGVNFTIDIDPKSGDYLTLNGNAKLDISSNGKDNQSIVGIYEINSGTYQLSFYDLVKKNFIIKPGSTIAWSGRPMDADMNITAEYVVRTSSVALVANENSSMSEEEKKIFNKRLPYEVKLNIRGLLSKPEISFNITLPNQYLSDNPLVEAKLRQLNMEEMTQQLNKQVFSLLVMGSFMAENPMETTGSSSGNIASTAARNSVNGILSSQLNNMSGKYISGVDVNFGLTSYEDYTTGSSDVRTEMDIQVSKKLFNDRLIVEAENSFGLTGSKKENTNTTTAQGYGQFAVIYSLTETGEYKLRAYYQNAYDPFDGDISYSGIALIFEKELDRFRFFSKPEKTQQNEKNK